MTSRALDATRWLSLAWLLAGASACDPSPPSPTPLPEGDVALFAAEVQPVLDARCADPGCHGRADRPLRLYSPTRFRLDPARLHLREPLAPEELDANARSVAAFALEPILAGEPTDACLVLRKPLARAAGGCGHEGGEIFRGVDDRGYRALEAWLATLVLPEVAP